MPLLHAGRQLFPKARDTAKLEGRSRSAFEQPRRGELLSRNVGRRCWGVVMVILLNWMACGCAARVPPPFEPRLNAAQTACLSELDAHAFRTMLPDEDGGGLPLSPSLPLRERGKGVPDSSYVPNEVEVVKACALVPNSPLDSLPRDQAVDCPS